MRITFFLPLFLPFLATAQIITTFAGNGMHGHTGDGTPATSAEIAYPIASISDKYGNYYFSEASKSTIREVNINGIITTIAGTGQAGYSGDGGAAITAQFNQPGSIIIDTFGNIYVADLFNNRIRKIDAHTGIVITIVGDSSAGYGGDGGAATAAMLNGPQDICFDRFGNLYIADQANNRIRKVSTGGIITTIAGNGSTSFSGEGGPATAAGIGGVLGICTDTIGNLYLAARFVSRVLKVDTAGILTTIAGTGLGYNTGDGGSATAAQLDPERLAFDDSGNLYVSCIYKNCVRKINTAGIIYTVVGIDTTAGFGGDGGLADTAELNDPIGLSFDPCGNLYIADEVNNRIRKVTFDSTCSYGSDTAHTDTTNAVQNVQANTFKIYPNPATTAITITGNTINNVQVIDVLGQVVYNKAFVQQKKLTIDISGLVNGVYFVKVNGIYVEKVVKE